MDKEEKKINVIQMSKETRERLAEIMDEVKGKDLFPEKTALVEKTLQDVKLPI
ncbi:hypothetical protein L1276_003625 [Flavobacterium sp. HSC-32F16]|uniref:hypothetical protein n=1 Tax=Flavobacterium sp. HSC-32F16 TaxID=2910964 RepID=UPI0020A603BE|nr:hypothetical protein [Flavobacterium sp. HSC-32F16]MCP2028455.1 hypothetical protein [Flavobacterium sp. HSC-32F16]